MKDYLFTDYEKIEKKILFCTENFLNKKIKFFFRIKKLKIVVQYKLFFTSLRLKITMVSSVER